nr:hypothetical protein [Tanacetum cinerariifolium]GEV99352.1 hypothetical protein [Tanacetum cinerariifolium]
MVSDSEDDSKAEITQNAPSLVQPIKQVKPPRSSVKTIETSIPADNHKTTIPKPKSNGNRRNGKACYVCKIFDHLTKDYDFYEKKMAQTPVKNHAQRENHQQYAKMTHPNPQRYVIPIVVLTKSKLVPITAARPVTTAVSKPHVTRPRQSITIVTKPHSPPRRTINHSPSLKASTFPQKVTAAKALMFNDVKGVQGNWGNPQYALKDKGVMDSRCSRHMTGNMSYLSDFEELNGGYVALYVSLMCDKKNIVLLTDTECLALSLEFKLPDENQVLLRVPRENNIYNVDLKNIVPSGDLTCLFVKETLDEGGKCSTICAFPIWSSGSTNPQNTDDDAAFGGKKPEFEGRKPEFEFHVSPSRYRNLSVEFEDFSDESINEVNATDSYVPTVGRILTNSTNTFSAAGPSNPVVSPTHRKSSYVNTYQ